jgi:pimeloyl-ACP methyl ester carboxylesterase
MAFAKINGINIHYETYGAGPPLLMLAPGGFDATLTRWSKGGVWEELRPLEAFAKDYRMIAYDRRELGESGGRVEPLSWPLYAREALGLLDHLAIDEACLLGGCIGCTLALAMAAQAPKRCKALLLHWPVGGYRWLQKGVTAFDAHLAFVREKGLAASAEAARREKSFWRGDPSGGPWASTIATDPAFAESYARQDVKRYTEIVEQSRDSLFHDTMPTGATGEQLIAMDVPAFIMSGDDPSHAHSAAVTLRELMPCAKLAALMPPRQNGAAVGQWLRECINQLQSQ